MVILLLRGQKPVLLALKVSSLKNFAVEVFMGVSGCSAEEKIMTTACVVLKLVLLTLSKG